VFFAFFAVKKISILSILKILSKTTYSFIPSCLHDKDAARKIRKAQ
jgi:hypothetical protein